MVRPNSTVFGADSAVGNRVAEEREITKTLGKALDHWNADLLLTQLSKILGANA